MNSSIRLRRRLRFLLCATVVALTAAHAQGQNGAQQPELRGQVERADGSPFREGALVKVENELGGMAAQVVTDSSGRFNLTLSARSRYTVSAHASGFRDASIDVDLGTVPRASIRLTLHETPLPASTATSSKGPLATVSVADLNIPETAQTEFEKGRMLLVEKHKSADSVRPLLKAIQIAPSYSRAHFLLGTAYMEMGQWGDAEAALTKAISFNDKLDSAYLALGSCLIEEKKFADAEKPLLRGLELLPDAAPGHYDLGRSYFALNRFSEAGVQAKSVAIDTGFPEAHLLLGNVLLRLRDGPNALAEFREYLRLAPNGPFAGATEQLVKKLASALSGAS